MAAQLMATKRPLRLEASCRPWASTSLPVPLSPSKQHGGIAGRDLLDHAAELLHARVAGDQPAQHIAGLLHLQAPVFLLELVEAVRRARR